MNEYFALDAKSSHILISVQYTYINTFYVKQP